MPKEIRYPNSESLSVVDDAPGEASVFRNWGDECGEAAMLLREDGQSKPVPPLDLMERTALFGEAVIRLVKRIPRGMEHPENNRLVDQLVGAGTSVGANYCEADDAVSGKDYRHKIGTCRKESKEAMFFLRMVAASEQSLTAEARTLWREAKELNLIFGYIWRKGQ